MGDARAQRNLSNATAADVAGFSYSAPPSRVVVGRHTDRWRETKHAAVFTATFFFFTGIMLIDYGATMFVMGGFGQSLLLSRIPPRIVYHGGIMLALVSFLLLFGVSTTELIRRSASHQRPQE